MAAALEDLVTHETLRQEVFDDLVTETLRCDRVAVAPAMTSTGHLIPASAARKSMRPTSFRGPLKCIDTGIFTIERFLESGSAVPRAL